MSRVLWRLDPSVKIAVALVLSLLLVLVIDPITPILFIALTVAAAAVFGGLTPVALWRTTWPLLLVGLGFVWTNALFARSPAADDVIWTAGPLRATASGLAFGLAIGLRGLAIGLISVTLIRTTDPTDLVVSLVRNARLPFRIGYALLAAWRFLPFITDERRRIGLAQRVRGLRPRGPLAALGEVVPLVTSAIGRATRVAVAMDARGFAAATPARTYFREAPVGRAEIAFAAIALAVALAILALGAAGGWLRLWDGRFSA